MSYLNTKKVSEIKEQQGLVYYKGEPYYYFEHHSGNFLHHDLGTSLFLDEEKVVEFSPDGNY